MSNTSSASTTARSHLLRLEILENRLAPAATTWQVQNNSDNGVGSLRDIIANSAAASGDTINFDKIAGQTITLQSQILTNKSITIDGGTNNITISGGGTSDLLGFSPLRPGDPPPTETIQNLIFTAGKDTGVGGAAIYFSGWSLTVTSCKFNSNTTTTGNGGAIYAPAGAVTLRICPIRGSECV